MKQVSDEQRRDILVKYIYIRHKEFGVDFRYYIFNLQPIINILRCTYSFFRRAILRFLVYPKGWEFVHNMAVTLFSGSGIEGSWSNIRPHGNSKGRDQWIGSVHPRAKAMVYQAFDENTKLGEVWAFMQKQPDPLTITRLHVIRYLYKKWCTKKDICCSGNPAKQLSHVVQSMKNAIGGKLVHSVIQLAEGNPVVTICPTWVQTLMLNCCAIRTRKMKNFNPSDLEIGKLPFFTLFLCILGNGTMYNYSVSDKTYNIGRFWVTNTSFQVPWLEVKIRANEKWSPVIPGPLFIHYESTELTYSTIFMSLNQLLRTKNVPFSIRFAITTDGEQAMINAAKNNVLGCIHSLCHRHLRLVFFTYYFKFIFGQLLITLHRKI